jgi:DNA polymerase-3 subunit delta
MKRELSSLVSAIKSGVAARCLLIFGDDLPVNETVQQIINALIPKEQQGFNLERLDGRVTPWERIQVALMTPPFFPGTKVVWIENAPYFISRENKGEVGNQVMQFWSDGKQQEASTLLTDLLVAEGWTQERWQDLGDNGPREIADLLNSESEEEVEKLIEFCRGQEIDFTRRRSGQAQGLEELLERGVPPWSVLLMTAVQVDRRMRLYKRLDQVNAVQYLGLERERGGKASRESILSFVNERLSRAHKTADARAREMILQRSGSDLRSLAHELEKLCLFAGEDSVLRARDVETIFTDYGEAWVFDLTDAVGDRNARLAISQLARLLSSGQHPLKLLATLASEVRRLLAARQLLEGELHGLWKRGMSYPQFQQQLSMSGVTASLTRNSYGDYMCLLRAERFSMAELCRYLAGIHDADLRLKSSGINARHAMERLVLGMCLGRRKERVQG